SVQPDSLWHSPVRDWSGATGDRNPGRTRHRGHGYRRPDGIVRYRGLLLHTRHEKRRAEGWREALADARGISPSSCEGVAQLGSLTWFGFCPPRTRAAAEQGQ